MHMDKSKLLVIVALFAVLMIFSGCVGGLGKPKEQVISGSQAFAGGSQGLAVSFIAGQPPAQVFEGQPFAVAVQIDNKGEADVSEAKVTLTGIDTSEQGFNLLSDVKVQTFSVEGVTKLDTTIAPGGQHVAIFDFGGRSIFATSSFTAQAVVFYNYETRALAAACLKENAFQQTIGGTEVCKISGVKAVQSSGAPIQVTSIEETPSGFLVKVRNSGKGTAFVRPAQLPESETELTLTVRDRVAVSAEVAGQTLVCTPSTILLANGEGQTFCRMPDLTGRGDFVEQLQIILSYGYVDRASTTFSVQDVPV